MVREEVEQCDEVVKVQEEQLSEEVLWVDSGILLSCSLYCPVNQSEVSNICVNQ